MSLKNITLNQRNQNKIVWFHLYLVHEQAKLTYELTLGVGCWGAEVAGSLLKRSTKELSEVLEMFFIWVMVLRVYVSVKTHWTVYLVF